MSISNDTRNEDRTTEEAPKRKAPSTAFTSESAREAGKKSAATRKAGPSDDAAIVRKLRTKAARGDVAAARELREWADRDAQTSTGEDWLGLLQTRERAVVRSLMGHVRGRVLGQVEGEWPGTGSALSGAEGAAQAEEAGPHVAGVASTG